MQASLLCLLLVAGSTLGARILGIFPTPSLSHHLAYQTLMKALVARGHHVTVLSPDPLKTPPANYTDIDVSFSYDYMRKVYENVNAEGNTFHGAMKALLEVGLVHCDTQLSSRVVQDFIKSNPKFDLVFYEDLMYYSYFGLIHHVGSPPIIAINILDVNPALSDAMGNPSNPSYDPNYILPVTDHMNFWERTANTIARMMGSLVLSWHIMPAQEALMRKYFGDGPPSVVDTAKNFSLYMVNHHVSLSYPRPMLPTFINIGGINVQQAKTRALTKELREFMEGAKHGFIYFSLGTNINTSLLAPNLLQDLMEVFAQLPQRVLFKWAENTLLGLPKNVKVSKWLPQQEVLSHPNIRLFMTHGGVFSLYESVYHAVPVVGFPTSIDQPYNVLKIVTEQAGLSLDYKRATKADILNAVTSVLKDPRYRKNMKRLSHLLKDQPETPLQRAIWWTEYVLRNKDTKHMRSAALDLTWYQYMLLDVAAFIISVLALLSFLLYIAVRPFYRWATRSTSKAKGD